MIRGGKLVHLVAAVVLVAALQGVAGGTLSAFASTTTISPSADTFVSGGPDQKSKNYGNWASFAVDASPQRQAFLRFVVPSTVTNVTSATLRLYAADGSVDGGTAYRVSNNSWDENTVTWNTKPGLGAAIHALGSVTSNAWEQVDVSAYVTGPGTYSFGVATGSSDATWWVSREGEPTQTPQLVLVAGTTSSDATAPTKPPNLTPSTTASPLAVHLDWDASSDNVGVAGYNVKRDGVKIATVTSTGYGDSSVQPSTTYSYTVTAYDAAGNTSSAAGPVSVTTPAASAPPTLDNFERNVSGSWGSGPLGSWTYEQTAGSAFSLDVNGHVAEAHSPTGTNKGNLVVGSPFTGAATARATFTASFEPSSGTPNHWQVILRHQASQTYYAAELFPEQGTNASLIIFSAKSGNFSTLDDVTLPFAATAGGAYVISFHVEDGSGTVSLSAKAWPAGTTAPTSWEASATDSKSDRLTSGQAGVRLSMYAGPVVATVDDFNLVKP